MNLLPSNSHDLVQRTDALIGIGERLLEKYELLKPTANFFIETVNGVSFKMIKIPNQNYYMGETPVTQELWEAVMGNNPSDLKNKPQNPVERVSWYDIVNDFLPALNKLTGKTYRLPTEAEWEYSAKGDENYQYAGSGNIDEVAWYRGNSYDKGKEHADYGTHPVKQKKPNEYGLYDMTGNVWERCEGWYDANHSYRALRGGSWLSLARACRSAHRRTGGVTYQFHDVGFRVVSL